MAVPDYATYRRSVESTHDKNEKNFDKIKKTADACKRQCDTLKAQIKTKQTEVDGFKSRRETLYKGWRKMADEIVDLQKQLKDARKTNDSAKIKDLEKRIDRAHGKAHRTLVEIDAIQSKLTTLMHSLQAAEQTLLAVQV